MGETLDGLKKYERELEQAGREHWRAKAHLSTKIINIKH